VRPKLAEHFPTLPESKRTRTSDALNATAYTATSSIWPEKNSECWSSHAPIAKDDPLDELAPEALRVIFTDKRASASLFQRRFKVGYTRAARILDQLENAGILAHAEGNKPREVIVKSFEEYLPQNEEQEQ